MPWAPLGENWACSPRSLPAAGPNAPGASVAVDCTLEPGQSYVVRLVLRWCAPTWNAGGYNWAGDEPFARQCRSWLKAGAMEARLWQGSPYLNCFDPKTGRQSELVFSF